ncbi:hypothetical protein C8J56DRAFT_1165112 [Mycena floridula]|nr:hypothetical protein C8J56DRAFT_1165112 [Mycena floridula]
MVFRHQERFSSRMQGWLFGRCSIWSRKAGSTSMLLSVHTTHWPMSSACLLTLVLCLCHGHLLEGCRHDLLDIGSGTGSFRSSRLHSKIPLLSSSGCRMNEWICV